MQHRFKNSFSFISSRYSNSSSESVNIKKIEHLQPDFKARNECGERNFKRLVLDEVGGAPNLVRI